MFRILLADVTNLLLNNRCLIDLFIFGHHNSLLLQLFLDGHAALHTDILLVRRRMFNRFLWPF